MRKTDFEAVPLDVASLERRLKFEADFRYFFDFQRNSLFDLLGERQMVVREVETDINRKDVLFS